VSDILDQIDRALPGLDLATAYALARYYDPSNHLLECPECAERAGESGEHAGTGLPGLLRATQEDLLLIPLIGATRVARIMEIRRSLGAEGKLDAWCEHAEMLAGVGR
jgi:hypothetical protein